MIHTQQSIDIDAAIASVWDYVRDIERWAKLFPGCRECTVINDNESRWLLKVGAGGLVRTVAVRVTVEEWRGPTNVDFKFELQDDPVKGSGSYIAASKGSKQTEVTLQVRVEGSGSMAPMWEAMSRPLLPQLAKAFAERLKSEIESREMPGTFAAQAVARPRKSIFTKLMDWLRSKRHPHIKSLQG